MKPEAYNPVRGYLLVMKNFASQDPRSYSLYFDLNICFRARKVFCKKNIDSFKFTQSKEVSDEGWLIKRVFASERRNKTTGKLELWRGHPANTRTDGSKSACG